jgi:hypothetical protein
MQQQQRYKLKLTTLTERQSAKGTTYLYGYLGDTEVIAFKGKPNAWGPTWDIFVQERAQRTAGRPANGSNAAGGTSTADLFQRPLERP